MNLQIHTSLLPQLLDQLIVYQRKPVFQRLFQRVRRFLNSLPSRERLQLSPLLLLHLLLLLQCVQKQLISAVFRRARQSLLHTRQVRLFAPLFLGGWGGPQDHSVLLPVAQIVILPNIQDHAQRLPDQVRSI